MITLDCETFDSALTSVSESFSVSADEMRDRLEGIKIDEGYEVRTDLLRKLNAEPIAPATVHWFHATRIPNNTPFEDGILPLVDSLPRILSTLQNISKNYVSDKEWEEFTEFLRSCGSSTGNNMESNALSLFRMKSSKSPLGGPFGFLIREIIDIPGDGGKP